MPTRTSDVMKKGWSYILGALERPADVPFLVQSVLRKEAHLGELLKLRKFGGWLENAGVRTVLDIGANSGQFATSVTSVLPDVRVFSFEPLPDVYEKLKRRVETRPQCSAFCCALGEKSGEMHFWRNNFTKSSSLLPMTRLHKEAFPWTVRDEQITVRVERLDDVVSSIPLDPAVLMKIDVQGYELNVLKGAETTLPLIRYIWVETSFHPLYEGQATFKELYSFLDDRGFRYAGSPEQLVSPLDGCILQEDVLFVNTAERA